MTRNEALQIAKQTREVHMKAHIDGLFGRGPALSADDELNQYGYRHGWYRVGEFSLSEDEVTGVPYDYTQGGWAYI
jgi:hypothetical protein